MTSKKIFNGVWTSYLHLWVDPLTVPLSDSLTLLMYSHLFPWQHACYYKTAIHSNNVMTILSLLIWYAICHNLKLDRNKCLCWNIWVITCFGQYPWGSFRNTSKFISNMFNIKLYMYFTFILNCTMWSHFFFSTSHWAC